MPLSQCIKPFPLMTASAPKPVLSPSEVAHQSAAVTKQAPAAIMPIDLAFVAERVLAAEVEVGILLPVAAV